MNGGGKNCSFYIILFVYYIICGGRVAGIGMMEEAKSAVCVLARRGRRLGGTIMMARCSILNKHFSNVSIPPPCHAIDQTNEKKVCFCIRPLSNCGIIAIMCKDVFMRWLDIGARVLNIAKRTVHIVCTAFLVVKFTVSPPRLPHCTSPPPSPPSPPPERDGCNHQISVNTTKTKTNPLSPSSSSENPGYDC